MNAPTDGEAPVASLSDDDLLRLEAQLCFPVTVAARLLVQEYRHVLGPMGLTHPQYLVMLALWQHHRETTGPGNALTAADLADRLRLEPATLTGLLRRLEAQGLLSRERDPHDDRRRRLVLTTDGRALREQAKLVPRRMLERLRVTPQQVGQIRDAATLFANTLSR